MIKLIRQLNDPKADEIESRFKDLVLSYKTEVIENGTIRNQLPKIHDGDSVIFGNEEIEKWFQELEEDLNWQRSLSGDGCYIDPISGKVC